MPSQRLLDEVRAVMRRLHYSIHTERCYCDWAKRFILFHKFQSRDQLLAAGAIEVEAFLTSLALEGNVAASTQNQALNALVFLYKHVLKKPLEGRIDAARSTKEPRIPVVLTRAEVATLLPLIDGAAGLVVRLIYGSGLRITEAVRVRFGGTIWTKAWSTRRSRKPSNWLAFKRRLVRIRFDTRSQLIC